VIGGKKNAVDKNWEENGQMRGDDTRGKIAAIEWRNNWIHFVAVNHRLTVR